MSLNENRSMKNLLNRMKRGEACYYVMNEICSCILLILLHFQDTSTGKHVAGPEKTELREVISRLRNKSEILTTRLKRVANMRYSKVVFTFYMKSKVQHRVGQLRTSFGSFGPRL